MDDYTFYVASLYKVGGQESFDKASEFLSKHYNYYKEKSIGGRTAYFYSLFAIKYGEFGIAMDILTENLPKTRLYENKLAVNLKIQALLKSNRIEDAYVHLSRLNFESIDQNDIYLSSENWHLLKSYHEKIKLLDKIKISEETVEEMVFQPIKLSDVLRSNQKSYEHRVFRRFPI